MNAAHSAAVKTRAGPAGCRESRTATAPLGSDAVSTQLPPVGPLLLLFRHRVAVPSPTPVTGPPAAGLPARGRLIAFPPDR